VNLRRRVANPWGRPRGLVVTTWVYVLWSVVPVLLAVLFSFNDGRSRSSWQGFSTRWYTGRVGSVANDEVLQLALRNTLVLALLTMLVATPLGVAFAVGLARWKSRAATASDAVLLLPLVTPEIVSGVALFLVFTSLYGSVPLGRPAQLIGHVTFSVPFVVVVVRARLQTIGPMYEEAARDLGASRWQALRLVILPQLWPAVFASFVLVFALSIDDFVVSSFLSSGAPSETVPMRLYSAVRGNSTPALNALATVMVVITMVGITLAMVAMSRGRPGGRSDAITDFARLEA
jgi:spermidine/putrescine transport system permease protein